MDMGVGMSSDTVRRHGNFLKIKTGTAGIHILIN